MLRGANVVTGTSSTGAGTLTAAACPAIVGGVDLHVYLTSLGFVNGDALLLPLKIIEFTDTNFTKPKTVEEGWYTVTLGAALTNMTIARTTPLIVSDANGSAYDDTTPVAFSIGTAANVLIFMGAGVSDVFAASPYFEGTLGDLTGIMPALTGLIGGFNNLAISGDASGDDWYWSIVLLKPLYVRRASVRVFTAYSGGTPVSSAYFRLYQVNSIGRPGRLLKDFGALGGANPLNATGAISTSLASPGIYLPPGEYFANLYATFTGGSAGPSMGGAPGQLQLTTTGLSSGLTRPITIATGGSSTGPATANTTSYAHSSINGIPALTLNNA